MHRHPVKNDRTELSHRNVVSNYRSFTCPLFASNSIAECFLLSDRQNDKLQIYNLSEIGTDRKWLQDILLSDTESDVDEPSDEDEYIREMLREHVKEKKIRAKYYQNPHVSQTIQSSHIPQPY